MTYLMLLCWWISERLEVLGNWIEDNFQHQLSDEIMAKIQSDNEEKYITLTGPTETTGTFLVSHVNIKGDPESALIEFRLYTTPEES